MKKIKKYDDQDPPNLVDKIMWYFLCVYLMTIIFVCALAAMDII